jgi:spermidine synthase
LSWPARGGVAKKQNSVRAICAFILMGLGVLLAQILLLRELMKVFSGNELTTGIVLAAWLLWTGAGSALAGAFADRLPNKISIFAAVQMILSVLLAASFLLTRYLRPLLGIPAGEIASLPQMIAGIFLLLIPLCLCSGFLFALGCSLLGEIGGNGVRSIGHVYAYEAAGAGIGGLGFSLFLIHILNPWQICLLTAALLASSAFLLSRRLRLIGLVWTGLLVGCLVFFGAQLDLISQGWGWQGYRVIASEDTIYGNITVIADGPQVSFFENGVWAFTYPDPQTAEEAVHFALLEHPSPRDLLLIGGGVGGLINEALKHPSLRHLDYVELDPTVVSLGRKFLPPEATLALADPRVEITPLDGRRFVQHARSRYDLVILHLPDPTTAQLNRCYTREFFTEVAAILRDRGIFYLSVQSSENIIGQTLAQFLSSLYKTMKEVFPQVVVLPGPSARFLGARTKGTLTTDPAILIRQAAKRHLRVDYIRDYYLLSNLSAERVSYLQSILDQGKGVGINTDLRPICYFYDIVLWSAQYSPFLKDLFLHLQHLRVAWIFLLIAAITLILLWRASKSSSPPLLWAVAVTGFSQIALEIVLILAFQIIYGYLYYSIGMIITAFMIGLALGSWLITAAMERIASPLRLLLIIQVGVALYALSCLPLILVLHHGALPPLLARVMEKGFPVLTLGAGFLGGLHFPLASKVYLKQHTDIGRIGGLLYGIDLAGSASGALAISVILLPVLGIAQGISLVVAMNLSAILCLGIALLGTKKA